MFFKSKNFYTMDAEALSRGIYVPEELSTHEYIMSTSVNKTLAFFLNHLTLMFKTCRARTIFALHCHQVPDDSCQLLNN